MCVLYTLIEGSLEVKLPTIWTDGKAEVGRVREEKIRSEKIREEKESEERRCRYAKRLESRETLCFPECVARVPVSLWWSGGSGCVRSTLRLRSQLPATVRNRSREGRMAVPMVSSAEGVLFIGFKLLVASFRVAGVALRDIQTCFVTC